MEQIMKQHRKMFQYVEEMLYSYDRRKGDKSKNCLLYTSPFSAAEKTFS